MSEAPAANGAAAGVKNQPPFRYKIYVRVVPVTESAFGSPIPPRERPPAWMGARQCVITRFEQTHEFGRPEYPGCSVPAAPAYQGRESEPGASATGARFLDPEKQRPRVHRGLQGGDVRRHGDEPRRTDLVCTGVSSKASAARTQIAGTGKRDRGPAARGRRPSSMSDLDYVWEETFPKRRKGA